MRTGDRETVNMSYLLHINASALSEAASFSRQVAASFLDEYPNEVVHRDLATTPAPHISAAGVTLRYKPRESWTPEEIAAAAIQDELIEEFLGAGAYLFTVPMYNHSMPSAFKAWIDQVSVVGRTIHVPGGVSTAGRRAFVVSARGGSYADGTPNEGLDYLIPTLEMGLGARTLGLDLTTIIPEMTLASSMPQLTEFVPLQEASLAAAHQRARDLAREFRNRLTIASAGRDL
jgi:FMN-dependent NADH-azoreductase